MTKCPKCLEVEPGEEPNDECLTSSAACPPWCSECLEVAGPYAKCGTCQYWHPKDDLTTIDGWRYCEGCIPGDIDDTHPPFPH